MNRIIRPTRTRLAALAAAAALAGGSALVASAPGASAYTCPAGNSCTGQVTGSMQVLGTFSLALDKTSFTVSAAVPGATGGTGTMPGSPALTATVVDNTDASGYNLSLYPLDQNNGNMMDGSGWWASGPVPAGTGGGTDGPAFFTEYTNTQIWYYPSGLAAGGQYEPFTANDGIVVSTSTYSAQQGDAIPQGFQVTPPAGTQPGAYTAGLEYVLTGH